MSRVFLSYSRRDDGRAEPVKTLIDDLVDEIVRITGWPDDDVVYRDVHVPLGEDWSATLLNALRTCDVFVPLLSPLYLMSEYCGKEWDGFSQRAIGHLQQGATRFDSAIVPVVWAPNLSGREPGVARGLQRFTPGPGYHEQAYFENGIYGLLVTGREDEYKEVTWRLARHIANTFYSCRVETVELEEKTLRDVFQEVVP